METLVSLAGSLSGSQVAWALASTALGYFVLGLTGFGSALVLVPLLAHHWPLTTVVPLVLMLDFPASCLHAWLNRRDIHWPVLRRLVPGMVGGAALGYLLAPWLAQPVGLGALGLYVAAVGLRGLRLSRTPAAADAHDKRYAKPPPADVLRDGAGGVATGVVETCFGTAGPILVAYLTARLREVKAVRASTPPALVIAASLALMALGAGGHLAQGLIALAYVPMLVISLLAVTAGHRLAAHLPARRLAVAVFTLLVMSGLMLLLRAAAGEG